MADATKNIDFLRFSAYSFKDLITRKLSEDSNFTDQVYEGSNLAILIDLCSYLFQGLSYCVNSAASESMFSDTQIYKNISRLVKLIGYNPKGFIPSTCEFQFTNGENTDNVLLPIYTAIDTNKFDSYGKKIFFSFVKQTDNTIQLGDKVTKLLAYNGKWKLYDEIFTASGVKYETFVLNTVMSDSVNGKFAAHGFIDVYVQKNVTDPLRGYQKGQFYQFQGLTDEIFANVIRKYDTSEEVDGISIFKNGEDDRYFSIRLNENKQYEIKFGNDNNGQKLDAGDKVYVLYLESNGFDAQFQIGEIKDAVLIEPAGMLGMNQKAFYENFIFHKGVPQEEIDVIVNTIDSIKDVTNTTASSVASAEEDVEDIRETAPDYYKLGNRLVSKSDYEYYIRNRYKSNIIDVKCQNNWDYISTFYGWLYKLGKQGVRTEYSSSKKEKRAPEPQYYINSSKILKHDYFYADPADENNVYLWIKMQNLTEKWKKTIDADLTSIKVLTSEMVYLDPIDIYFEICAAPVRRALDYLDTDSVFDSTNESYLEITVADNTIYSNTAIKTQINVIFNNFFKKLNMSLGQVISINDLEQLVYGINGIQRIRTVFSSKELDSYGKQIYQDRYVDGISFATWSANMIDAGDDLTVSTMSRTLEDFQFPCLYSSSIVDKIKVIKKSFSNSSTVQY